MALVDRMEDLVSLNILTIGYCRSDFFSSAGAIDFSSSASVKNPATTWGSYRSIVLDL